MVAHISGGVELEGHDMDTRSVVTSIGGIHGHVRGGGMQVPNGYSQKRPKQQRTLITQKEVLPAVLACAVWGHQWKSKGVQLYSDEAAVAVGIPTMHL